MTKRQTTKGNIETKEQRPNTNGNTNNSSMSRQGNKEGKNKIPVKAKTVLKVSRKEMEEPLPAEILKPIKNLNSIQIKIEKLEKLRGKIILRILKNNPH